MVVSWNVWHQTKKSSCLGPLSCRVACCRVVSHMCELSLNFWIRSSKTILTLMFICRASSSCKKSGNNCTPQNCHGVCNESETSRMVVSCMCGTKLKNRRALVLCRVVSHAAVPCRVAHV